ncbi:conserved membrane hypothetical protein [Candidatus Terasakiella magnetica]|uniref:DUF445 domain-containing protein n=1 Tax=Candidatus Terasakiella magnetica TaxID=1867952 RepID=A0A1C3RD76_9PROT|nr:DUF445 domain-containing protein [Candidatus Terasakiella magnetica]SCA55237.1 conserved membrane hypothetical protein [Candidatus Terasakiella magnetica]
MNKSALTNLIALALCVVGFLLPAHGDALFTIGLFALSGGLTNWLAVHMLFEKVPLLYGSGVIPNRFDEFKAGIKKLIIEEFFSHEHIERFFEQNGSGIGSSIVDKVDFDRVFNGLTEAIESSSLGGMLSMVGGKKALEPLREPVNKKLEDIISELANGEFGDGMSQDMTSSLVGKVEEIIDNRLNDLTPQNVKDIVQDMIRKHLGWLVVWGGVFGGLIGLLISLVG